MESEGREKKGKGFDQLTEILAISGAENITLMLMSMLAPGRQRGAAEAVGAVSESDEGQGGGVAAHRAEADRLEPRGRLLDRQRARRHRLVEAPHVPRRAGGRGGEERQRQG